MKFVKSIVLAALFLVSSAAVAQQQFGVISTQEVMMNMPALDTVQTKLQEVQNTLIEEMQAIEAEYTTAVQEFQAKADTYTQTMREQKQKDIQSLLTRMQGYEATAQREMQEQQQILMAPVQQRLLDAINKVSKEKALLFVFEKQVPLYVSESQVLDITGLVMAELGIGLE